MILTSLNFNCSEEKSLRIYVGIVTVSSTHLDTFVKQHFARKVVTTAYIATYYIHTYIHKKKSTYLVPTSRRKMKVYSVLIALFFVLYYFIEHSDAAFGVSPQEFIDWQW